MGKSKVLDVVNRHGDAMASMNADIIIKDYAEDAIVITNLWDKPVKGHEAIKELIKKCLQYEVLMSDEYPTNIIRQECIDGYALHVFEKNNSKVFGVETYIVKNDKIVFETAYIQFDPRDK